MGEETLPAESCACVSWRVGAWKGLEDRRKERKKKTDCSGGFCRSRHGISVRQSCSKLGSKFSSKRAGLARHSLYEVLILLAVAASLAAAETAPTTAPSDLVGGRFATNCGNATAAPIFDASKMSTGLYGVTNVIAVSDPDIVLIGNQWWMIFATGPGDIRAIEPFAAYLPPGASLSTSTTYPSDPNGWHLVGARADGTGIATPISPIPGSGGWDEIAAETPSADVGPDGTVSIYYAGHNAGQTPFQIGLMTDFSNGQANGYPSPVMSAQAPWEFSSGLSALLEQSVRWMPQLNKFVMYYTAGAWWASPPDNALAYAESTDGISWVNRQKLDFSPSYYNQDFLYNSSRNRYEMVISNDPTGVGGANPRNLVWRTAATPAVKEADWVNEVTLLQYDAINNAPWYNSGILSPAVKYGNLPGETNRMYVYFHSYTQQGDMFIGRFYCDAVTPTVPTITWATPAAITYGTALSTTQLDATSTVAGSFTYTPPAGTVLNVGQQTLSVQFVPNDTTDYTTASAQVNLQVNPATAPEPDFTIRVTGADSATISKGSSASFTFALAPINGAYPGTVSFTVSGLPTGANSMVSPSTFSASAGPQSVTVTINTAAAAAGNRLGDKAPWLLALLLPVILLRPARSRFMERFVMVLLLATIALAFSGCGSGGNLRGETSAISYNVNVAATSGTATHTASVVLTVQ